MLKKIKRLQKITVICALAALMFVSTTVVAVGVTCYPSKSGLKKSAYAEGTACASVGCIIYTKKDKVLASGENGLWTQNKNRTKTVSYTGLSAAYKAYAYAVNTKGASKTSTKYY